MIDLREGWLSELSVGDKVVVSSHSTAKDDRVDFVRRITPSGRIVVGRVQYEPNGRVNIGAWNKSWLEPYVA